MAISEMEENLKILDLENALEDCNVNEIFSICQGKPIPETIRPEVWKVFLDVRNKSDQLLMFNEVFDLPSQKILREDVNKIVEKIGNDDEQKVSVKSDLESILTFYSKNRKIQYVEENGWVELLLPLLSLKLKRSDTYNLFESIREYIPNRGNVFHVFRLLLLYHDPSLCSFLDTKKISPEQYSTKWFQSLFASSCELSVILSMWDLYFQSSDPFLLFFLSLIILINGREHILAMTGSQEEIVTFLSNMPCALEVDDVVDFCSLAQYYSQNTPSSFKAEYMKTLFGMHIEFSEKCLVSQALCLPATVYELVENSTIELSSADSVRFFLVDCRPAHQYNAGHLSTAFHLDCDLMLEEPVAFQTAVQGLLRAQRMAIEINSNAGGEHLCFMGSGRDDEDQYTHMVVSSFLQRNIQYVSLLSGGYKAIHDYFGEHMIDCLEDHDAKKCLVCQRAVFTKQEPSSSKLLHSSTKPSSDFFSKLKERSAEVKVKLLDIIVNPNVAHSSSDQQQPILKKSLTQWKPNVFSIDDDEEHINGEVDDPDYTEEHPKDIVNLKQYVKSLGIHKDFKCQEVHMNGYMYDSNLIITESDLIVLRDLEKGQAQIIVKRPLTSIAKITAKKRHKELITFKYGYTEGEKHIITDMDRFLIPNAIEATNLVRQHIGQLSDDYSLPSSTVVTASIASTNVDDIDS
ncbi:TBC1D23 family protein [Megaselia abdita]